MICRVTDKNGERVEVSLEQFTQIVGDRQVAPFALAVRKGKLSIEEVPEEHREAVAAVVAAREAFSGPYQVPATEALAELVEVFA